MLATLALLVGILAVIVGGVLLVSAWLRPKPPFSIARGRALDALGLQRNVKRKRWESDAKYRARIMESMNPWRRR